MIAGSPWRVDTTEVYAAAGSSAKKLAGTGRTMLAGFTGTQSAVSEQVDISGNVYRTTETLDRSNRTGSITEVRPGASSNNYAFHYAGRLYESRASGAGANVLYGYDALGRPVSVRDPRHSGTAAITYEAEKNRVWRNADATGAYTQYAYHASGAGSGQVSTATAPNGTATTFTYDLLGRHTGTAGAGAYPVTHTYTAYGERHTMTTWRSGGPPSGGDVTTWTHEPATGLLTAKTDAAGVATSWTYDTAGRLLTRLSPRGITATYGYDPVMRELISVTYTPGGTGTPNSGFVYDRLGRQASMTQGGNSWVYAYDPLTLLPDTETVTYDTDNNGTGDFTRVLDRSTDSLLRPGGWTLAPSGGSAEHTSGLTYEAVAGRLQTVSGGGDTFTYAYAPNAPHLISTVTGPGGLTTNQWDPNRDTLDYKENKFGATVKSKYDYTVNSMGRRDDVTQSGTAFTGSLFIDWNYNDRGEVTYQNHPAASKDFVYEFDGIGNRKKAALGLTLPGTDNHAVNSRNQYTSIGGKSPAYDADGNLYTDGGGNEDNAPSRTHLWDGENQLIQVTGAAGGTAEYRYDPLGRRITKKIGASTVICYIYDGWNLIGEYQSGALQRTHVWGLDLSGSLQGAGGVGGLLCTHITGVKYYPLYDGNGNITQYLDAAGGIAAHYDYSPFGFPLEAPGGSAPHLFEFRFSTKKLDFETDFYYYGYRYYSPWMARWINRDPIGERGGVNLMAIDQNDLINYVDVLGLKRPCAENFARSYPDSTKSSGSIYDSIGGWLGEENASGNPNFEDSCAIRISIALNGCGGPHRIPSNTGINDPHGKKPDDNHIIRAGSVCKYLKKTWGNPDYTLTNSSQFNRILSESSCQCFSLVFCSDTHVGFADSAGAKDPYGPRRGRDDKRIFVWKLHCCGNQ